MNNMRVTQPSSYWKAIYATAIAFASSLATVMVGDVGWGEIESGQWLTAGVLALVAGGGVLGLTNAPVKSSGS